MGRLISFLAAFVVLLSAATEIASFAIDHRSWLQANVDAMRDYAIALTQAKPAAGKRCDTACADARHVEGPRCEGIEPFGKKVLCYLTLPSVNTGCAATDCEPKGKPALPGDWIRAGKQSASSATTR